MASQILLCLPLSTIFFGKPPCFATGSAPTNGFKVSCNATSNGEEASRGSSKVDRRNLLLGMGGLYGATDLIIRDAPPSLADPITTVQKCSEPKHALLDIDCCPGRSDRIIDYTIPRVRPAAHLAPDDYIAKYKKATELMKALPADDPRNFIQQANVHCAYCNDFYPQSGDSKLKLEIHHSWLFFPWHRWYLYFYERILAKLIDDATFALPFWNWDNPPGMPIPAMYTEHDCPLYDSKRNPAHVPAKAPFPPADLRPSGIQPSDVIASNLAEMYGEMVRNAVKLEDFYGAKYCLGSLNSPGAGSVERGSHDAVHDWVGNPHLTSGEDMGNFTTAGRDPVFFAHHANVDRLWSVWRDNRGGRPKYFTEPDWLETSFLFYNENAQLVRVKVKDALDEKKMGYTYQKVDLPWLVKTPKMKKRRKRSTGRSKSKAPNATDANVFPVRLDKSIRVLVDRAKQKRSKKEKEEEEELLVIEGIGVDSTKFVRFEVFVNDKDDDDQIDLGEYAGTYSQLPHKHSGKVKKSKVRLGLTELLEDLDVEDDDQILVSLVPKAGGGDITIDGVKIIYD